MPLESISWMWGARSPLKVLCGGMERGGGLFSQRQVRPLRRILCIMGVANVQFCMCLVRR